MHPKQPKRFSLHRIFSFLLTLALGFPSSAFSALNSETLRPLESTQSGVEAELTEALTPTAADVERSRQDISAAAGVEAAVLDGFAQYGIAAEPNTKRAEIRLSYEGRSGTVDFERAHRILEVLNQAGRSDDDPTALILPGGSYVERTRLDQVLRHTAPVGTTPSVVNPQDRSALLQAVALLRELADPTGMQDGDSFRRHLVEAANLKIQQQTAWLIAEDTGGQNGANSRLALRLITNELLRQISREIAALYLETRTDLAGVRNFFARRRLTRALRDIASLTAQEMDELIQVKGYIRHRQAGIGIRPEPGWTWFPVEVLPVKLYHFEPWIRQGPKPHA